MIIATGASARLLGLPSERALIGHGVSTCATCDGYFFRGKPIAVVGGGDSAMEEAIFLTRFASQVTVVHRRDTLRASKIMQDKAFANPKISFEWNTEIEEIKDTGKGEVTAAGPAEQQDRRAKGPRRWRASSSRSATRRTRPSSRDSSTWTPTATSCTHDGSRTSVPGVFACGDVQDHVYRQAITAAGSGCMAAIDAEKYLEGVPQHLARLNAEKFESLHRYNAHEFTHSRPHLTWHELDCTLQTTHLPLNSVDPSSPKHLVILVEDHGLSGRDGVLRLVEDSLDAIVRPGGDDGRAPPDGGGGFAPWRASRVAGAWPAIQFTFEAVSSVRSSASRGPTVTALLSGVDADDVEPNG